MDKSLQAEDVVDGRYEIMHRVGEGGMGEMYLVKDRRLDGVKRALKMLKQSDQQYEQWFEQEAKILTKLQHRCLPTIYDYHLGDDNDATYLVMDWIDGIDLEQFISQQQSKMTLSQIITIGIEVLHALQYLHEQQPAIIHRDLKPSNIMITRAGTIKVIDFGISKFSGKRRLNTAQFGTPGFCAPEQLFGQTTNERSDIYSFGAVIAAMLGISLDGYYQHVSRQQYILSKLKPLPKLLREIITACIALQQQDRPRSISEVLLIFEQLQRNHQAKAATQVKLNHNKKRISVLALETQAGTTCCAIALAELLKEKKQPVSVIELQRGGGNIAFSLMEQRNREQVIEHLYGFDKLVDNDIHYYAVQTVHEHELIYEHENTYTLGMEMIQLNSLTQYVVTDAGSRWQEEDIPLLVDSSDLIVIVCTPWIASLPQHRLRKLRLLLQKVCTTNITIAWVFNRDQRFKGRGDWLALANNEMKVTIPEMKMKQILADIWTSTSIHRQPYLVNEMKKRLRTLTKTLE